MSSETIEIHIPDVLYHRLERLAALTHRPLESLILQTLSSSLPPLPDDLAPDFQDALLALEALSDDELQQVASSMLPESEYERLSELRAKRGDGGLAADEGCELDSLAHAADLLTLRKAYAAVLLKWREQGLAMPASRTA